MDDSGQEGCSTRSQENRPSLPKCSVFGIPREIDLSTHSTLPTYEDIVRHINFMKHNSGKVNPDVKPIIFLADIVSSIWVKASLPPINLKTIKKKI